MAESNCKMADVEPFAQCDVCNKTFSGPEPYSKHLWSKNHENNMVESRKKMKFVPLLRDESTSILRCNVCIVSLTGEKAMEQHESGKKHLNNLKNQNILDIIKSENDGVDVSGVLKCDTCQKSFTGPENYQQHLKSKKHARKIELAAMKRQLNGGLLPSCPSVNEATPNLGATKLYPQLGNDYDIVHREIENSLNVDIKDKKKKKGCFPLFEVRKKKDNSRNADKNK